MGDPRNVAHAKKVSQEKHHKDKHASKAGSVSSQRAKAVQTEKKAAPVAETTATESAKPPQAVEPTQLEKSLVVLSKLKELEFHSRANIEKLAELSLTIEEELKQKPFAEAIGAVYAAQNAFQSKILKLIEDYEAECTRSSGSAWHALLIPAGSKSFPQSFARQWALNFEQSLKPESQNLTDMKTRKLFTVAAISAGLAFGVTAQAKEEKHEEQTINSSDVPAAVQQAAQAEAKGGTIVRWEKEGANFEAVIDKNGKQIGVEMNASGKVLSKHNEAKEHKEKGEKY